jgi:hypothetical protein
MNSTIAEQMARMVIDNFMENTTKFDSNTCLDLKEDSVLDIYNDSNCYFKLSINIQRETEKSFPDISVIVGETSSYSNYNTLKGKYVTIVLGPLYFIIMQL